MTALTKLLQERKDSFSKRKQRIGESVTDYAAALKKLAADGNISGEELLRHFVENLPHDKIKDLLNEIIQNHTYSNFDTALLVAYGMESAIRPSSASTISGGETFNGVHAERDVHIHGNGNYHDQRAWSDVIGQGLMDKLKKTAGNKTIEEDLINGMKELRMNYQNSKDSEEKSKFSGDAQTTYNCLKCKSVIGKTSDVCKVGDFESYAVKRNPYGYTFNTVTIASIQAYREDGEPTLWATWFDGYAWTICCCSGCAAHIGWQFRNCRASEKARVVTFFCLTLAALETSKLPSACT